MIGAEELDGTAAARRRARPGAARDSRDLEVSDDAGQPAVRDLSLSVRGGEIVGVAGVSGNGQHELVEALAGQRLADAARSASAATSFMRPAPKCAATRSPACRTSRCKNACVGRMSVAENLAFRGFDRPPLAIGGTWLRPAKIRGEAERRIAQYRIRTRSPDTPLAALSGGNVQRAVLARELDGGAEIMIAANPCFGLDFSAVAQIHAEIVAARNRGAAVLLVSSDLDEILEIADRLVVMFNGRLVHEFRTADADLTEIGRHMAGH